MVTKLSQYLKISGKHPEELTFIGNKKIEVTQITQIMFNSDKEETHVISPYSLDFKSSIGTSWINIIGIHDSDLFTQLAIKYELHPLGLADIQNTLSRPQFQEYNGIYYLTLKMITLDNDVLRFEHVGFVITDDHIIVFQEQPDDVFDPIRQRIRENSGLVRRKGREYLLYLLLDAIVDEYYAVAEHLDDEIDELDNLILTKPSKSILDKIVDLKKELSQLTKSLYPSREAIRKVLNSDLLEDSDQEEKYFVSLLDHSTQIKETLDYFRERANNQMDMYNSTLSNNMNQVMKTLTIVSTIFIPLTFIAGIYGMNFVNMPELRSENGYFIALGGMVVIGGLLLLYFKRKKWLE